MTHPLPMPGQGGNAPIVLQSPQQAANWLRQRVRGGLTADSRQAGVGDGFIAWPGAREDGRRFVAHALAQGAAACLVEHDGVQAFSFDSAAVACYPGLKAATGLIADAFYGAPSRALDVMAVTGTNGKTSTAWWLAWALSRAQAAAGPCALVGTLGIGLPGALAATGMTTPDPVLLQAHFRTWADAGVRACAIEASSIGLDEHRLDGTAIRVALFTNFTQDHLDYHGDMQAYWQAKEQLFRWPGLRAAVINVDDAKGKALADWAGKQQLDVWATSLQPAPAVRLWAENLAQGARGLTFTVRERNGGAHQMQTALVGEYNVSNLLGVLAALRALGLPLPDAVRACTGLPAVPGRMEPVVLPDKTGLAGRMPLVLVDYAHTPDALEKALQALRPVAAARGGRLWAVFGCGGNRDAAKRPLMGAAACRVADALVITSDNPRGEEPAAIMADVLRGVSPGCPVHAEVDRAQAIAHAVLQAAVADVVLIAGKGHEDYQEVAGVRRPFSDQIEARSALMARAEGMQA